MPYRDKHSLCVHLPCILYPILLRCVYDNRADHQHLDGLLVLRAIQAGGLGSLLLQEEVRFAKPTPCCITFFNILHEFALRIT
jgi:hypothetical protein